jgi:ABC-2 type transport system permease protein
MLFSGSSMFHLYEVLDPVSVLLYFLFTLIGVLLWNAMLAGVASVITDPNSSGKSQLMFLPMLFVLVSMVVLLNPDHGMSVFLSWFPLTASTAMPMRWVSTPVAAWEVVGAFLLLVACFYAVRKLAAAIFRISILINGKEPSWTELMRMLRH